ncbi:NAD-P-binding protein, partial [Aureobasidium melanogenum]|uniref:NAD-P-binding protein n=1 Tax=Aureobasidium melanogenum (strain CBS 110374) TaxID=1043003 RepID=A0A074VWU3_AURM1
MSESMLHHAGFKFTPTIHNDTYDFISTKSQNLKGKRVFLTGASKGIGKETALSFARAGASSIALGARSSLSDLATEVEKAAKDAGHPAPKVVSIKLDVTDRSSTEQAAKTVKSEFGGLDFLFNNAGYLEEFKKVAESDPDEWWRTQEVNIKGPYLVARAFIPLLLDTKDGDKTIINTSSIGAHMIMTGASSYQVTKLALLRLGEFISQEYADQKILCYGIHPGGVMTELAGRMPESSHHMLSDKPELAADTVAWLVNEKREWLAGRYVSVTWDMKELLDKKDEIIKKDLLKVRMLVD